MSITSADICHAADQLNGLVGFHRKRGTFIVRFSEDAFGLDVSQDSLQPCSEFVWRAVDNDRQVLCRQRLGLLLEQHVDDRLNIGEPLRLYLKRVDLPEIVAERTPVIPARPGAAR
ncbi:DUF2025 family protein [Pseudomonas cremoricolorata]|uniref:PA1123-like domain-containing protein n=1 Tax=Pseudomonas cremoricolorata TaxID=157783 RepID=A0A089WGS8_9PSED|nr:DUF2025 family protein [Pseudomonas cremoricolorata]AIR87796.1 hypothetical protein LK03_00470 [Pseudomonas cremoricolorata]